MKEAPPIRIGNKFICPLCKDENDQHSFQAINTSKYNRHLRNKHLKPQPDREHLNNLWVYALYKKIPGTAYREARDAGIEIEIQEMPVDNDDEEQIGNETKDDKTPIEPTPQEVNKTNPNNVVSTTTKSLADPHAQTGPGKDTNDNGNSEMTINTVLPSTSSTAIITVQHKEKRPEAVQHVAGKN